ncbi:putative reverse transcriptase/RNA-dependent DNA polymerase [Citrus sinensis]|nr:putative reverse transcriptase/RNA-dependent DNA polymerase [Citrus sinensis]
MNESLGEPFTAEEVLEALSQMCPTKAPGPDGLPAVFYQKHWYMVKEGVLTTCLHILNSQEAFSSLLQQAEQQRLVHGLSFGNNLKISYLLFADDSLVFSRASMADCQNLKMIFERYSTASGQIFNFKKSSLFLSGNVQQDQAEAIGNLFQLNIVSRHEKYLGLPSMIGRKRSSFFNDIKLKVSNKISSWQHKFFSCGGKEVLIKAGVQAIPAYAMSVFKIPMGVCDDIQKMVAKFWWGSKREERNIHWAKWEKMSQAKCLGGMGFHDFSSFNRALLSKQGWRIQHCPDSLVARVLQAKYFQSKNFLDAKLGSNPSYIWRSLLWGRKIICSGSRWRVGNGQKIHVRKTNWIPQPSTFQPVVKPSLPPDPMVSELINEANCWDEKRIYEHFDKMDADLITKIPLPRRPREDELIWHYGKNGQFSVRSGYQTALQIKFPAMPSSSVVSKNEWNIIWSLTLPQKIRIFAWRAAKNQLPSAENLWKKKII